jgi:hypothetical protein
VPGKPERALSGEMQLILERLVDERYILFPRAHERPRDAGKSFISFAMAAADIAALRASRGGHRLSGGMLLILACVVFDGYEFGPRAGG